MSTMKLLFVVFAAVCAVSFAKHVHPRHVIDMEGETNNEEPIVTDIDGLPIELIRKIKPGRFVPLNNALFFTKHPPCKEGFERDLLGICREVWN